MAIKIKLNSKGIRELLKSPEIMSACQSVAQAAASRAGSGYSISVHPNGKTRGNVSVFAETDEAKKDNLSNNTLLKVTGASKR